MFCTWVDLLLEQSFKCPIFSSPHHCNFALLQPHHVPVLLRHHHHYHHHYSCHHHLCQSAHDIWGKAVKESCIIGGQLVLHFHSNKLFNHIPADQLVHYYSSTLLKGSHASVFGFRGGTTFCIDAQQLWLLWRPKTCDISYVAQSNVKSYVLYSCMCAGVWKGDREHIVWLSKHSVKWISVTCSKRTRWTASVRAVKHSLGTCQLNVGEGNGVPREQNNTGYFEQSALHFDEGLMLFSHRLYYPDQRLVDNTVFHLVKWLATWEVCHSHNISPTVREALFRIHWRVCLG